MSYAVQAVGVSELGVDRLVQVPVEFCAECVQFAAGGLAMIEIQGQQILQIVGVGATTGWQCSAQREVEERSLDVVQRFRGIGRCSCEARWHGGERSQDRMADERSTTQNTTSLPSSDCTFTAIRHG